MHKFSTAPEEIIRPARPTRKRVPLARGATYSARRFRRFVTRTHAQSGLGHEPERLKTHQRIHVVVDLPPGSIYVVEKIPYPVQLYTF